MADETFEIDIDVELKHLKKATATLRKFRDMEDRAAARGARLARVNQRIEGRQMRERVQSLTRLQRHRERSARAAGRAEAAIRRDNVKANNAIEGKRMAIFSSLKAGVVGVAAALAKAAVAAGIFAATFTVGVVAKFSQAVVGAKEFDLTTKAAFESLTGSASEGAKAMAAVEATADRLSLSTQDTATSMKKLLAAQFTVGSATEFISLAADLRAVGATAEQASNAIRAITQIKAKGKFLQEEQQQLSEAGLSKELVDAALIKNLKLAGKTELQKVQAAGKVTGDQALKAIKDAILTKTHGEAAGDAAAKFAAVSIESMGIRIKNSMFKLYREVAAASPEAFKQLSEVGSGLTDFFKSLSRDDLSSIFTTAVNGFNTLIELTKAFAGGFIEGLVGETDSLDDMFTTLARPENLAAVKELGVSFSQFASAVIQLTGAFANLPNVMDGIKTLASFSPGSSIVTAIRGAAAKATEEGGLSMRTAGSSIMAGLMAGIRGSIPDLDALMRFVGAKGVVAPTEQELGIKSPSKVFEGIGQNVVEGFDRGIDAPSHKAAAKGQGAEAAAGGGLGATNNFNMGGMSVSSEINGAQDSGAVAAKVEAMVTNVMARAFESMALQSGVA